MNHLSILKAYILNLYIFLLDLEIKKILEKRI